ncbi:hypothetical protein B0H16DRAFT_367291 [Mycena metata]|uniref:Uncharacterized protein n=1 Tax=Mycena metata TaxID=1033252 RepID=A0AAD7MKA7_9AGAR|nr:hypothetical protein B0H16DRAFT_367291 [Mycena metata]
MNSPAVTIPPLGHWYLQGIWAATLLFGINCALLCACVNTLLRRRTTARVLLISCFLLWGCSAAHVAVSFAQLTQAFTPPVVSLPSGPDLYFADAGSHLSVAKNVLYGVNVFIQDLLLIWRLYVVWNNNWKVIVLPLIVEMAHMAAAFVTASYIARGAVTEIFAGSIRAFGTSSWSLDIALNISVTCAIAARLWWMDRQMKQVRVDSRGFRAPMYTIVESGAILMCATLILYILDQAGSFLALVGLDSLVQLATLTPLLLLTRVGLGLTHGDGAKTSQYSIRNNSSTTPVRVAVTTQTTASNGLEDPYSVQLDIYPANDMKAFSQASAV